MGSTKDPDRVVGPAARRRRRAIPGPRSPSRSRAETNGLTLLVILGSAVFATSIPFLVVYTAVFRAQVLAFAPIACTLGLLASFAISNWRKSYRVGARAANRDLMELYLGPSSRLAIFLERVTGMPWTKRSSFEAAVNRHDQRLISLVDRLGVPSSSIDPDERPGR